MTPRSFSIPAIIILLSAFFEACGPVPKFISKNFDRWSTPVAAVPNRDADLKFDKEGITIQWVGHASMVIHIYDKVVVTDPNYGRTIGLVARRMVEPGIDPSKLHHVDATIISHLHFDHFNFGSIDMLPKNGALYIPLGGIEYTPDFGFRSLHEMAPWKSIEHDGLKITAVPVQHFGGRYGFDISWMRDRGYTGYIIEYRGKTIFFGGDLGYHPTIYKELGNRYSIDIALLPIAPIEPRDFMAPMHVDPGEALQVMEDVGAVMMIPMHHSTYDLGLDPSLTYARELLASLVEQKGIQDRVAILDIGGRWTMDEQHIFQARSGHQ
jgi:L-ascorbate metabolism protein UlaG (beta-lactamase superfamily)